MERDREIEVDQGYQTAVALPRWFVYLTSLLLGICAVTVLPWVVWQTRAVMRLEIQMDTLAKIEGKLDVLLSLDSKMVLLERRLDVVEEDIASRRGLRWNKPDHEKYVQPRIDDFEDRLRRLEAGIRDRSN